MIRIIVQKTKGAYSGENIKEYYRNYSEDTLNNWSDYEDMGKMLAELIEKLYEDEIPF